jgi:hypothetical protein
VQLEFHFCTLFTVRSPDGRFHHQLFFYWNVRWQARFHSMFAKTALGTEVPWFEVKSTKTGTGAHVGHVMTGTPGDPRFTSVLTSPQRLSCNAVAEAAATAVSAAGSPNRHESPTWMTFPVGHR